MNKQEIEQNLIFLFIRGSHAYGLNTPSSDFDIGSVCLPNKKIIYGLEKFEQDDIWVDENGEKVDKTVYVLQKIVNMLLENNPNALDFLYAPEHVIKLMTPAWKRFVDIRDEFVSIKCKYSFQGYAYSQLRRLETHRSYLLHPPKKMPLRSDYGLPDVSKFPVTQIETLARISNDYVKECDRDMFFGEMSQMINREGSLIFKKYVDPNFFLYAIDLFKTGQKEFLHSISSISGKYVKDELVEMAQKELSFMSALDNWKRYEAWKKGRNKKRASMEELIGYDPKFASHLIRLQLMAHEIVSGKGVLVDRTNIDAEYLMDIKNGKVPFEEMMKESEEINKKTDAIYKDSKLKSEPNRELVYNTMTEVLDEHFGIGK